MATGWGSGVRSGLGSGMCTNQCCNDQRCGWLRAGCDAPPQPPPQGCSRRKGGGISPPECKTLQIKLTALICIKAQQKNAVNICHEPENDMGAHARHITVRRREKEDIVVPLEQA